jgi:hypothetical protein
MINFAIDEVTNPRLRAESTFQKVLTQARIIPGFSTPVVQMRDPEPLGPPPGQGHQPEDDGGGPEDDFSDPSWEEETKA